MIGRPARALLSAVLLSSAGGCAPALRTLAPPGPGPASDAASEAAEVHAIARRVEQAPAGDGRAALAAEAVAAGQRCQRAAPSTPPCDYALAIALGIQARERPSTVHEGLEQMAALLRRAAAAEPDLDRAGPDRVLALLLLRAPGWPLGPGDEEAGLAAARRAADRFPAYAPNQLALAEALQRTGDREAGRDAARRALRLAEEAERTGEPDAAGWRRQASALAGAP